MGYKNMESAISEEESYRNSYNYFIEAVKILSASPEKQCELMDNYNVAWEIKDDVSAGQYLINNPASSLAEDQKYAIRQLITELNKVTGSALNSENTPENNLTAMKNPIWGTLRKQATMLLRTLESETKINEEYFK